MKKGNIIDLQVYRNHRHSPIGAPTLDHHQTMGISQELEKAIKLLIVQMREHGPLQKITL